MILRNFVTNVLIQILSLFFHLNIASLPKHFDELKSLLNQTGHDFSIIGLTETAFQSNIPPANCHLDGYSFVHTPAEAPKGGALIYIHNNLEYG